MIKHTRLWAALCLLALPALASAKPSFKVFGYLPNYALSGPTGININANLNTPAAFPWQRLTHVMEAFAIPNAAGNGIEWNATVGLQRPGLVAAAHSNNTRVMLSLGGADPSGSLGLATRWRTATNAGNIAAFVADIMNKVQTYGYDGVDVDWEFPNAANAQPAETAQFMDLMQRLYNAHHNTGDVNWKGNAFDGAQRHLTFFISPGYDVCGVNWSQIGGRVDYGIVGGYDFNTPFNGPTSDPAPMTRCNGASAFKCITSTVQYLTVTNPFPSNKLVLGMPMYSQLPTPNGTALLTILRNGVRGTFRYPQDEETWTYNSTTHYMDVAQSYCRKMTYAFGTKNMPGIALWSIDMAFPQNDGNAELTNIWRTIEGDPSGGCSGLPSPCLTCTSSCPSMPAGLVDFNDGDAINLWAGNWALGWIPAGSTGVMSVTMTGYPASTYSNPPWVAPCAGGPNAVGFGGNAANPGTGVPSVQTALAPGAGLKDVSMYNTLTFWMRATTGSYRFVLDRQATRVSGGNDHYGANITVAPADNNVWKQYTFFYSQLAQAGWGGVVPPGWNDVISIAWMPTTAGAYNFTLDDVEFKFTPPTPTPTRTPTFTYSPTNTRTPTGTPSSTVTPSNSPSPTPATTFTSTVTPSATRTITASNTPSATPSRTATATTTVSNTPANTSTSTSTPTGSATRTSSPTASATSTGTPSRTASPTFSATASPSNSPSITATRTSTSTNTPGSTPTYTSTPSFTGTGTPSRTASPSFTATATASSTATRSATPSVTATSSITGTNTPGNSPTYTITRTATPTGTSSRTASPSFTATATASSTATRSATPSITATSSITGTNTPGNSPTYSVTPSATRTNTPSGTPSGTPSSTITRSATPSITATSSITGTNTPGNSPTYSVTPSITRTNTPGSSPTYSVTPSSTITRSATPSVTVTSSITTTNTPGSSPTYTITRSSTPTSSSTATPSSTLTSSATNTPGNSPTSSVTPSITPSATPSSSSTLTPANTATSSSTATPTRSATPSSTVTPTAINAAGQGTCSLAPSEVLAGSNATLVLTYAAGAVAFSNGMLTITLPAGWPAPSLSPSAPGYVTVGPGGGVSGVSGQTVTIQVAALGVGSPLAITLGSTSGGGPGLSVPAAAGSATFVVASDPTGASPAPITVQPQVLIKVPTATPVHGGPCEVVEAKPDANPNPSTLWVKMAGPADSVRVEVFTKAFVKVRREDGPGCSGPGWVKVPVASTIASLPAGFYIIKVVGVKGGSQGSHPVLVRVLLSR